MNCLLYKTQKINYLFFLCLFILLKISFATAQTNPDQPNILVIIGDDIGVDYSNGYQENGLRPTTPTLDSLRTNGLTFTNAWAAPICSPTRATILSGKYGVKTGVLGVPGHLDITHPSLFKEVSAQTTAAYAQAVVGKWHLSSPIDNTHPAQHGLDHFEGVMGGGVGDYFSWNKVTNGVSSKETEYATTHFTNSAIDWINTQNQPWFLWLAHVAAHTPFHIPPDSLFTIASTQNNQQKYIAAIEAMDKEIGRLLSSMSTDVLANTLIIYIGDNGTPQRVLQNYADGQAKGSLYQGGVHIPMIVAGAGVSRKNEAEEALVHSVDLYATVLEAVGVDLPGGIYNSLSFHHLLSSSEGIRRPFNYTEVEGEGTQGWTIRDAQYKLINFNNNNIQGFYDLINDPLETTNLIGNLTELQQNRKSILEEEAIQIRTDWSCQDLILNGTEISIDDCNTNPPITAIHELGDLQVQIYPNPTSDYLNIGFSKLSNYQIQLFDLNGKVLLSKTNSAQINLVGLRQGTYFLELSLLNTNQKVVEKIIVIK